MEHSSKKSKYSNARSPKEAQKLAVLKRELLKRPNIGYEIFTARLLAMLDPGDAVIEAELNNSMFHEYGLHKEFCLHLAGVIRDTVLKKGRPLTAENVRKALPI